MSLQPGSRGTGLIRQPLDPRDYKLSDVLRRSGAAQPPPTSYSLRAFAPPIWDQYDTNRCQVFAWLRALAIQRSRQKLEYLDPCFDWTYRFARIYDDRVAGGPGSLHGDSGATNRQAGMSLVRDGYCKATHRRKDGLYDGWPNGKQTMDLDPEQWWQQNQYQTHKLVLGLYECDFDPQLSTHHHKAITTRVVDDNVLAMETSISSGFAVVLGIPARESLYGTPYTGIMSIPTDSEHLYGYHSICAIGYDRNMQSNGYTGFFHIDNSWGPAFGQGGSGWMPYAWWSQATQDNMPFDLWAVHWAQ